MPVDSCNRSCYILSDLASSCLAYGAVVALRSSACVVSLIAQSDTRTSHLDKSGWSLDCSFVFRRCWFLFFVESCNNFPAFFFVPTYEHRIVTFTDRVICMYEWNTEELPQVVVQQYNALYLYQVPIWCHYLPGTCCYCCCYAATAARCCLRSTLVLLCMTVAAAQCCCYTAKIIPRYYYCVREAHTLISLASPPFGHTRTMAGCTVLAVFLTP